MPFTEKQPLVRLMPPVELNVEVPVEKLMPLVVPIESKEPGEVVPMPTLPCRLAKIILPFEPPDAPVPGFKIIFPPLPPVIAPLPPLPAVTVTVPPVPPLLILIPLLPPLPATKVNGPPAPPLPELFEPLPVVN